MDYCMNYKYIKTIGKGKYGRVFLVNYKEQIVALKIINKKLTSESAILKYLTSKEGKYKDRIVQYIHSETILNDHYLFMEYVPGKPLLYYLEKLTDNKIDICRQIAEGISFIHNLDIVHRDIKSENIIYYDKKIKIIDFGFSCALYDKNLPQCQVVNLGSPIYQSPELLWETIIIPDQLKAADIYALGVTFYEIMSNGNLPFVAEDIKDLKAKVLNREIKKLTYKSEINALIYKMISYLPDDRPDIESILNELLIITNNISVHNT